MLLVAALAFPELRLRCEDRPRDDRLLLDACSVVARRFVGVGGLKEGSGEGLGRRCCAIGTSSLLPELEVLQVRFRADTLSKFEATESAWYAWTSRIFEDAPMAASEACGLGEGLTGCSLYLGLEG